MANSHAEWIKRLLQMYILRSGASTGTYPGVLYDDEPVTDLLSNLVSVSTFNRKLQYNIITQCLFTILEVTTINLYPHSIFSMFTWYVLSDIILHESLQVLT